MKVTDAIIPLIISIIFYQFFHFLFKEFTSFVYEVDDYLVYCSYAIFLALCYYLPIWKKNKQLYDEQFNKLIQKISITTDPRMGKVEHINFTLSKEYEKLFYNIRPNDQNFVKILKELNSLLEKRKSSNCYGYDYATKHFYIDDKEIFRW